MTDWKRDIGLLVVLQLALGLPYLNSVPRIYVDEVWDSSLGYSLANTGSLKHPFVDGLGGMDIHYLPPRVILPMVCAAVFKITDHSIAAGRVGSVLFGALAVVSLYAVMRRWFGGRQAFFIALVMIVHPWFFEVSRRTRPEVYYIALSLVFLWLLVVFFDRDSRRAAFFAGVFAGLSGLAHPNGLILVLVISCAVGIWQSDKLSVRLICWAAAGFVIIVLPYVVYVLWAVQNPQVVFSEQMQVGQLQYSLTREIERWKGFLKWPRGAGLALIMLLSWTAAWYRSKTADKILATTVLLYALILPFVAINVAFRYLAAIIPFFCALGVRLVWRIMTREVAVVGLWYKSRLVISASVAIIYLTTSVAAIGLVFYRVRKSDLLMVTNRIASVVGPESRIIGDPIFWIGHDRYQYGPWLMIIDTLPLREAIDWARKYRFDYAVRTAWFIGDFAGIEEPPQSMPDFRDSDMLDYFCALFGTKVYEFRDPYYGPVEIYELNWYDLNWDEFYKMRRKSGAL